MLKNFFLCLLQIKPKWNYWLSVYDYRAFIKNALAYSEIFHLIKPALLLGLDDVDHGLEHLLGGHVHAAQALAKSRPVLE